MSADQRAIPHRRKPPELKHLFVNKPWLSIRGVLVTLSLIALAGLLTVPWSYLVIRAAYNRDIAENAKSLARRVEQSVVTRVAIAESRGLNTWGMRPGQGVSDEVLNALGVEMSADPTIRAAVFFYVTYTVSSDGKPLHPSSSRNARYDAERAHAAGNILDDLCRARAGEIFGSRRTVQSAAQRQIA